MDDQVQLQDDPFDKQKTGYAKGAIFLWIISGVYLFLTTEKAHFFSWQGAIFFLGGLFASSLVFGAGFFVISRLLSRCLVRVAGSPFKQTNIMAAYLLG